MEYLIKNIDTDEKSLIEIARFLSESFPKSKKFTHEFIKWQYTENPLGTMVGFNAWHKEQIISHFAALPISMNIHGKDLKGLLCINVATNSNYRGKQLFTKVGEKTIEYARDKGFDFMIAVPNGNSSHAFLKYFGFTLISPLTVKIGLGKKIYNKDQKFNCYKTWDESQWQWRLKSPANKYFYNSKGILSSQIMPLVKSLSLADLSTTAEKLTSKTGFSLFNLYIGLGADTTKGLYINIPSFVKRPPFNLVYKDLKGNIPTITKEDVFIQLIDMDTI